MTTTELPSALHEVMSTARATRRFDERPIDRATLRDIVEAATWAPSPRNTQPWEFVVVDDAKTRAMIGDLLEPRAAEVEAVIPHLRDASKQRMYQGAADLIRSLGRAPAIVFVCGREHDYGPEFPAHSMVLSATYTAAQNLLLAARARGLGAAFTTLHLHANDEIRETLGVPADVTIEVTIPVGWPATGFGPLRRRPVDDVLHWNRLGG
jgi:nitroreductase